MVVFCLFGETWGRKGLDPGESRGMKGVSYFIQNKEHDRGLRIVEFIWGEVEHPEEGTGGSVVDEEHR